MSEGQRRKVLIVDDDRSLLGVLQRAFQNAGAEVVAHSTFEGARGALKEGGFDGLQLAVISRDAHPETRVIVFSGFDDPVLRGEAERIGAAYVVKPVTTESLLALAGRPRS